MTRDRIERLLARDALSWAEAPHRAAKNVLDALEAAGLVVVPKEPTPTMLGAFWRVKNACPPDPIDDYSAYRAMIAAATP